MFPPLRAASLGLVLLWATQATARPGPLRCEPDVRHIRLEPGAQSPPPEVCIQAGKATTLLFDRALRPGEIRLEGRTRFRRAEAMGSILVLVPGETLTFGMRVRLEVPFREEGESAAFVLVASSLAERQVEVSQGGQAEEALSGEELRTVLQQCRQQLTETETWWARSQNLAGAVSHLWLTDAVISLNLLAEARAAQAPGFPWISEFFTYRADAHERALRMGLRPREGAPPWKAIQATLQGPSGEWPLPLEILEPPPLPGRGQDVLLHVPPSPDDENPGPYTLVLVSQGAPPWIIPGVRFP
ncbi:DUF2381 family protein [Stigmatella aurantiaca]|uniref:Conserved uncharacterized protein n=1 Tax=Stigmatella aurantiaca (strain DW4/3-1) TaxID=378806 RepID=Q08PJ5_STIAD|nr:DUF2381 family protein [Stigmatella aurantiaca]ADO76044.1 conserved uncharacterized protein [Stigmatella aurantiaca DW4/3-1]EAU62402.1 hypothetical protein STIAU_3115 [Stigmatella aurantiaca DW4/3-1]